MESNLTSILLIESDPQAVAVLEAIVDQCRGAVRLTVVPDLAAAGDALAQGIFDAILAGPARMEGGALPDLESLGSLEPDLPILVVADWPDESLALQALRRGAQDYLVRGQLDGEWLSRALSRARARKGALEALMDQELRAQTLINALPALIVQIRSTAGDLEFRILKDFPEPLPAGEWIASRIMGRQHGEGAHDLRPDIQRALATGEIQVVDFRLAGEGGVRHYETQLVKNAAAEVLAIIREVTDDKQGEAALKRYAERLQILRRIDQAILAAESPEAIARAALRHMQRLVPSQQGSIAVFDLESHQVTVFATHARDPLSRGTGALISFESYGGIETLKQGRVQVVGDLRSVSQPSPEVQVLRSEGVRAYIRAPLISREELIGALSLESFEADVFLPEHVEIAREVADSLAIAIRQARLFNQIQHLAITDELTGLFNRRQFFSLARREFERLRRYGGDLSAIMLDVDNFKAINDRYGHAAGDRVLHQVAQRLHHNIRQTDILARYGGDEFVILLPETNSVSANQLAQRLRHWMASNPVDTGHGPLAVHLSLGVASTNGQVPDVAALIDLADADMYAARQTG